MPENWSKKGLFLPPEIHHFVNLGDYRGGFSMSAAGKGAYIWNGRACGATPALAVYVCQTLGLSWVALKVADGTRREYASYGDMAAAVQTFRSAGFKVWGWHYIYGEYPEHEAAIAAHAVDDYQLDGYIINAEQEFVDGQQTAQALRFTNALRGIACPVALSSYRFPKAVPRFPWEVFLPACDIAMPQIYWNSPHPDKPAWGPEAEFRRSKTEYSDLTDAEFVPTGRAFIGEGFGDTLAASELTTFLRTARENGCPGVSFWSLDTLIGHNGGKERQAAIKAFAWSAPPTQGDDTMTTITRPVALLPLPRVSQLGAGADENSNDCGAGAVASVVRGYFPALQHTVDRVYQLCYPGGKNSPLWLYMLREALGRLGIPAESGRITNYCALFEKLRHRVPVIALIHYADLVDAKLTQYGNFRGAHYVTVVGMDTANVYIHDPYTTGDNGQAVPVPLAVFWKAWENSILDGNMSYQAVWPTVSIGEIVSPPDGGDERYRLTANVAAAINIRANPYGGQIIGTLARRDEPVYITGQAVNGYIKLRDKPGWVWYQYLERITSS